MLAYLVLIFLIPIVVLSALREPGGVDKSNFPQLLLVVLPNLFHPVKLWLNITHPIKEWVHTRHNQYAVGQVFVVEHWCFGNLETVDVIVEDQWSNGLIGRVAQLFRFNFYYGHAEYFPRVFRLLDRTYVPETGLDIEIHVSQVLARAELDHRSVFNPKRLALQPA